MARVMSDRRKNRLLARIDELTPHASSPKTEMSTHEMICHLTDQVRCALGLVPSRMETRRLPHPVLRWIKIYAMGWSRDQVPTCNGSLNMRPRDFEGDREQLRALIRELASQENVGRWPPHPYLGRLSGRMWADVTWKHFNHHLRQFGV